MSTTQKLPKRSHGIKLIVICVLVLLMAIPAMFISYISYERSNRADDVTREVSSRYGGPQDILGPVLVVPYSVTNSKNEIIETGDYIVSPENGQVRIEDVEIAVRKRSLFKVPTYVASININADFIPDDVQRQRPGINLAFERAKFVMAVSDGRGLREDIFLNTASGKTLKFAPAAYADTEVVIPRIYDVATDSVNGDKPDTITDGLRDDAATTVAATAVAGNVQRDITFHEDFRAYPGLFAHTDMAMLAVPAGEIVSQGDLAGLSITFKLAGASQIGVLPFGKSTTVDMQVPWTAPGFEGGYPPLERTMTDVDFTAKWSVPYLARGILGEGKAQNLNILNTHKKSMRVKLVSQVNPYQTVNRALKYAVMFIGIVFIAYFLFEVLVGVRVHPAQYILIGIAQSVFYLLLLAFSEQIGFTTAFLIAATATIVLTAAYAGAVFGARKYAYQAGLVFTLTYGLLYALMRMQDFALMIGALASFIAIALTMYLTRNLDWYGERSTALKTGPASGQTKDMPRKV